MKELVGMAFLLWMVILQFSYAGEIHNAIRAGDEKKVASVLKLNAHALLEPDDYTKETPLHVAARCGRTNILVYLLDCHAPIEATNSFGQTALQYALNADHSANPEAALATVRILVSRGADVNALDATHQTALHYAAENGQVHIAEALLQQGAKTSAGNGRPLGT